MQQLSAAERTLLLLWGVNAASRTILPGRSLEISHATRACGVIGVDDCGTGAIAGPIFAAAVRLPTVIPSCNVPVVDAKLLSQSDRAAAFDMLLAAGTKFATASVPVFEIDRLGHRAATDAAMVRAIELLMRRAPSLPGTSCYCLVDGDRIPIGIIGEAVAQGDGRELCIAAASIFARVCRDAAMQSLHRRWPMYDWHVNGGHASPEHLAAIVTHGPSDAHRTSCFPFSAPRHRLAYHPHRNAYAAVQRRMREAERACEDRAAQSMVTGPQEGDRTFVRSAIDDGDLLVDTRLLNYQRLSLRARQAEQKTQVVAHARLIAIDLNEPRLARDCGKRARRRSRKRCKR